MAGLSALNALPPERAVEELLRCCGSRRWALAVAAARPFPDREAVLREAELAWRALGPEDWLEAFSRHPRIGDKEALRRRLEGSEQAGVRGASEEVLEGLARGNREYEEKFGFVFLICATGKSAAQMLEALRARLGNGRDQELRTAAAEQEKITRLRLERMLAS